MYSTSFPAAVILRVVLEAIRECCCPGSEPDSRFKVVSLKTCCLKRKAAAAEMNRNFIFGFERKRNAFPWWKHRRLFRNVTCDSRLDLRSSEMVWQR